MNVLKTKNLVEVKLLQTKENSCFSAFMEKGCYMETGDHLPLLYMEVSKADVLYWV